MLDSQPGNVDTGLPATSDVDKVIKEIQVPFGLDKLFFQVSRITFSTCPFSSLNAVV